MKKDVVLMSRVRGVTLEVKGKGWSVGSDRWQGIEEVVIWHGIRADGKVGCVILVTGEDGRPKIEKEGELG